MAATQPIVEWWPERGTQIELRKGQLVLQGMQAGFGHGREWMLHAPEDIDRLHELIGATSDGDTQAAYRKIISALKKHGGVRVRVSY
jgi:hypothetical protein